MVVVAVMISVFNMARKMQGVDVKVNSGFVGAVRRWAQYITDILEY